METANGIYAITGGGTEIKFISIVNAGIPWGVTTAVPKLQKLDPNDDIKPI